MSEPATKADLAAAIDGTVSAITHTIAALSGAIAQSSSANVSADHLADALAALLKQADDLRQEER